MAVARDADVTRAVLEAGDVCRRMGLRADLQSRVTTAVSELARNILKYAGRGVMYLDVVDGPGSTGIRVVAQDRGPGIADPASALRDHYSTSGTLGLGLPGVRRLMDDFELDTKVGEGTRVTVVLWS